MVGVPLVLDAAYILATGLHWLRPLESRCLCECAVREPVGPTVAGECPALERLVERCLEREPTRKEVAGPRFAFSFDFSWLAALGLGFALGRLAPRTERSPDQAARAGNTPSSLRR